MGGDRGLGLSSRGFRVAEAAPVQAITLEHVTALTAAIAALAEAVKPVEAAPAQEAAPVAPAAEVAPVVAEGAERYGSALGLLFIVLPALTAVFWAAACMIRTVTSLISVR